MIVLLVPMLIIFINFVAKKFLWFSGRFERKHSLAAETYASTRNMALLSIINTGFILLIANYDFGSNLLGLNILQGGYGRFNSSWYRVVGSQFAMTCLLMTITTNFFNMGFHWMYACFRCRDRGCTLDMKHTK